MISLRTLELRLPHVITDCHYFFAYYYAIDYWYIMYYYVFWYCHDSHYYAFITSSLRFHIFHDCHISHYWCRFLWYFILFLLLRSLALHYHYLHYYTHADYDITSHILLPSLILIHAFTWYYAIIGITLINIHYMPIDITQINYGHFAMLISYCHFIIDAITSLCWCHATYISYCHCVIDFAIASHCRWLLIITLSSILIKIITPLDSLHFCHYFHIFIDITSLLLLFIIILLIFYYYTSLRHYYIIYLILHFCHCFHYITNTSLPLPLITPQLLIFHYTWLILLINIFHAIID